jgi:hypothetical protein
MAMTGAPLSMASESPIGSAVTSGGGEGSSSTATSSHGAWATT